MFALATALLAFTHPLQETQLPGAAMAERVTTQVEAAAPGACDAALDETSLSNAENLFIGAGVCFAETREDDGVFLLLAGQARASADMALAMPDQLPEPDASGVVDLSEMPPPPFGVIDLYGFIYGYAGGAGSTEFYRDAERTSRLFERLEAWRPLRPPGYNPGWAGSRVVDDAAYAASVETAKVSRKHQLLRLAQLYRDEAYYALQAELDALLAANNNQFEVGTAAHDRFEAIQAEQGRIAERIVGNSP